jgi:hypothetical protein
MTPEPKQIIALAYGMAAASIVLLILVCFIATKAATCWA